MGDELVFCHSGAAYAERPAALLWSGERLEIEEIETRWHSPGEFGFRVRVKDARRFTLVYSEAQDAWRIEEI